MYNLNPSLLKNYITLEEPIILEGFSIVGYFPYERACIRGCVSAPRKLYSHIEIAIRNSAKNFMDNKIVVVCKDTTQFGTDDFAIQLHDLSGTVGSINQIEPY